ncbi:hypothetical protein AYI68_g5647 [Smittium mucronatum]|uniref:Uncharacterized protein n=1 Tax=Smittium mucronatum TaxID=133383 RepID=A0A1R0GTP0_9FUNG|nr:hypothetical protein AYI68_g5647 [Smittium mucronatum]
MNYKWDVSGTIKNNKLKARKAFFWGLYRSPKIAVRIGDDVSKPTDYLCGLHKAAQPRQYFSIFTLTIFSRALKEYMSLDSPLGYLGCSLPTTPCYWQKDSLSLL